MGRHAAEPFAQGWPGARARRATWRPAGLRRGTGRLAVEVNSPQESGPLDGVCFRAGVLARTRTAVLEHLVAVRPNVAKLRRLWRQVCASARQMELPGESERARPGDVKVNGETERESVRVHLSAGALSRGRRGRAPVGGELPRARECAGPGPTWTNSFGLPAAAETAAPSTCHGPPSPVGHLCESESRSAQAARALRSTKGQLRRFSPCPALHAQANDNRVQEANPESSGVAS